MSDTMALDFLTAFQLRQACCRALLELSRRQSTLISQDDYAEMLKILQSKQALIEHLDQLAREQQPLRAAWHVRRETLSAADRERCERALADTESLLAEVLATEQASVSQVTARRAVTRSQMQSLSVGVQAQQAYQARPQPVLSRLDLDT